MARTAYPINQGYSALPLRIHTQYGLRSVYTFYPSCKYILIRYGVSDKHPYQNNYHQVLGPADEVIALETFDQFDRRVSIDLGNDPPYIRDREGPQPAPTQSIIIRAIRRIRNFVRAL